MKEIDLSIFEGRRLDGLILHKFNGAFIFDDDKKPHLEFEFDLEIYYTNEKGEEIFIGEMRDGGVLLQLLGENVTGIQKVPNSHQLIVEFANKSKVQSVCCGFLIEDKRQVWPK